MLVSTERSHAMSLLYRYGGQRDIAVGSNIARRNRPAVKHLIGYLSTSVILRTKLSADWSFGELLNHVRDTALGAYAHQDIPLDCVVQELAAERDPIRPLIFHVTFTLQNLPSPDAPLGSMELKPFNVPIAPAKNDIQVFVSDTGGPLLFGVLYNMDLFNPETITAIFEHYSFLLQSIIKDPEQQLAKFPLCSCWREGDWRSVQCRGQAHKIPA
jgi:non-ribosomal peptide synthetase component F